MASYQGVSLIDASITMPRTILLNMDDERIDSSKTVGLYQDQLHIISFAQGGHRFENIGSDEVLNALSDIQR